MTKIAGIGTPGLQTRLYARIADLMTAQGFQQAVTGVGHVAVVAQTAARARGVMGMLLRMLFKGRVALQAGCIAFHASGQLIRWRTLMHPMAGTAPNVPPHA